MLTAHALSIDDTLKFYKEGAASYISKQEMHNITTFFTIFWKPKRKRKAFGGVGLTGLNHISTGNLTSIGKMKTKTFGRS